MRTRHALLCAAACLSAQAAFAEARPPRPVGDAGNAVEACARLHGGEDGITGRVEVTVAVDAAGRVTGMATPPGTPEALAAAAQCVAATMRFEPALDGMTPVAGQAIVAIAFPTPPRLRQDLRRAIAYCQPAIQPLVTLNDAYEGVLDLRVKVGKDGRVVETKLPPGVLPWMEEAAGCLAGRLDFYPARVQLEPVEAWTTVPVDFNLSRNPHERVRIDAPALRSGPEDVLAAYRACYPAGRDAQARIDYRITVTRGGVVRRAEAAASSGDAALDEAGACILRRLRFVPARRNGRNVEATVGWPILVRPPD